MDAHEMEQLITQLTPQERHQLFVILRRVHLQDCLRETLSGADEGPDPEG